MFLSGLSKIGKRGGAGGPYKYHKGEDEWDQEDVTVETLPSSLGLVAP